MDTSPILPSVLLVHGQLCDADLLVVRINVKGKVLPPLIIFQDFDWNTKMFCQIVTKESARMPLEGKVDFCEVKVDLWEDNQNIWELDKESRTYLHKYFATNGACVKDIQACIILPLDPNLYEAPSNFPLLNLLRLESFLTEAWAMNEKWCKCEGSIEDDDIMILCDNTECEFGWYHIKCCCKVSERDALLKNHEEWYCTECQELQEEDRTKTTYDNEPFDKEVFEKSDERIQRARTVYKVWENFKWPKFSKISKAVRETEWQNVIPIKKLEETVNGCCKVIVGPSIS